MSLQPNDHRWLGRQLDLFSVSDRVGPGLILWHPRGTSLRLAAEDFSRREHLRRGYAWVQTPHIGRDELWRTSGHLDFYADSMYPGMASEGQTYYVKPMSCPFHIEIYASRPRSYRELPIRLAEIAAVYRYERSGVIQGLTRARGFCQDDAHLFCTPDQVPDEIAQALDFALFMLRTFGLTDFEALLSTKPSKAVGPDASWESATAALRDALTTAGIPHDVDQGGGAFYGPKIDLNCRDALGRQWQLGTIQFDFNLPERFDLSYTNRDGRLERPIMIHRALFGSVERFLGILIEHYRGAFPTWLAPVQVLLVPVATRHVDYMESILRQLTAAGVRAELDSSGDSLAHKIAAGRELLAPYMLIAGDREVEAGTISVRTRAGEVLAAVSPGHFLAQMLSETAAPGS